MLQETRVNNSIIRRSSTKPSALVNKKVYSFEHKPLKFLNLAVFKKLRPSGSQTSTTTIRQAFLDVSMANHHEGLVRIAESRGVDVLDLKPGDFLLFINPGRSYIKIMGANCAAPGFPPSFPITSVKAPRGRISPLLLRELPKFFNGKPFDYDSALKPILEAHLLEQREGKRARIIDHVKGGLPESSAQQTK